MRIVGGTWGGRRIVAPAGRATRPTADRVREAWMSAVAPQLPDANVLDLFAGSGALGLEALSRGARHVTFVEKSPAALRVLERNIAALMPESGSITLRRDDALKYAEGLAELSFDLAFADPPYGEGLAIRLAEIFIRSPFARLLCIEHGRSDPLPDILPARQRRYGETLLTFLRADDAD